MAHYSIALLPGDGIGVEIALQARRVLERITQPVPISIPNIGIVIKEIKMC